MQRFLKNLFVAIFLLPLLMAAMPHAARAVTWQGWTDDLFSRAKAENRFVILDLEAVWCHWCHVMEEETYKHPEVLELLEARYIPVRVDQDANPDISSRYGDWGWPATIVFAPDGTEIVKLRGYLPAPRMIALLKAIIDDPSPGPSVIDQVPVESSPTPFLTKAQRKTLLGNYNGIWDDKHAGWGMVQKFIHTESLDYAIAAARRGDAEAGQRAQRTLDAALNLIDPVWGGVYQYSDQQDWLSPHYEKIMWFQAQNLRQYALAYLIWQKPAYLEAARDIYRYMTTRLLSPNGAFFTSQDADLNVTVDGHAYYKLDDKERRALGMPRIDTNIYARENGWAISALIGFYNATGDAKILEQAVTAARWVVDNRLGGDGVFRHGKVDRGGPYLADTLAMGQAFMELYAATGQRDWLARADAAGTTITDQFQHDGAGFVTSKSTAARVGVFTEPVRQIEENIQLARFANQLHRYTGKARHREMAVWAMRYLTSEQITAQRRFLVGIVLAEDELGEEPIHITIVGRKDDPAAIALHKAARAYSALYKRVDWWDKKEGPMVNADITYPELEKAAAFACGNRVCSLPVFKPAGLDEAIARMARAASRRASQ